MSNSNTVYDVHTGMGYACRMVYRIHTPTQYVEYALAGYWQYSPVSVDHIRKTFPLVAKNVRFK